MVLQQVSFVERLSLSQRVPYWRFHHISRFECTSQNLCNNNSTLHLVIIMHQEVDISELII